MKNLFILKRNLISNWLGFGTQVVITFLLTPFVLSSLGDVEYGIWALVISLTGYYGLLDMGMRSGLTQYIGRYLAKEEYDNVNQVASTGTVVLLICAVVIALASVVLAAMAPWLFQITDEHAAASQWAIVIIGCSVAFQFPFFVFASVFNATQRFDLSNVIGISTRVLVAVGTYVSLKYGSGLLGIAIVTAAGNILDYLLRWRVAHVILPQLRVKPWQVSRARFKEIMSFSLWSAMINTSMHILYYTDAIIVGLFLGPVAITYYALAARLSGYFSRLFNPVGPTLFPMMTQMDAREDHKALTDMILIGSRLMCCAAISAGLIVIWFSEDFYRLWVGDKYVEGGALPAVHVLFGILIVGEIVTVGQRVAFQSMLATRRLKPLARILCFQTVFNLLLSIVLLQWIGLIGVAVGTAVTAILFQGLLLPRCVCSEFSRLDLRNYFIAATLKPIAIGGVLAVVLLMMGWLFSSDSWASLVLSGVAAGTSALLITFLVALDAGEKRTASQLFLRRTRADSHALGK